MSGNHNHSAADSLRRDPEVKKELRNHLGTDNYRNFFFIGRAYLVAGATMALAIMFFEYQQSSGISFWWNLPVLLAALILVGGSQHQFAGAGHEAVHHTLFKNRTLNEVASDLLCMFPIMTSTYQFRLYHLAHHQFVNDPERDPDFSLLKDSGHWMEFPVKKLHFIMMMVRQLLLADLVRYIIARIKYNTVGTHDKSPYRMTTDQSGIVPSRLGVGMFIFLVASLIFHQKHGTPMQLVLVNLATWMAVATCLAFLPERFFDKARIKPVFHPRFLFMAQTGFYTVLLSSLGYVQMTTEFMALRYFSILWYLPMATTFPFFMILRQVIQHGNGDRGWLTNTRVFRMNALVRYTVFPFGMDYHLPHHMYATVPHYRLKKLHEFLMGKPDYSSNCQLVDNYIIPDNHEQRNPTVVEVLGPEYACVDEEIHIDDSVLDDWEVEEKDEILSAGRPEAREIPPGKPLNTPG
ncbi:MAG: fatty acid desaturase [Verrucomicrobiales bacterium]|nr:fatty acid desaturase [Verrucomicrobiales bacterium]